MDVDHRVREALEERLAEQLHVAGEHDQPRAALLQPVGQRLVARLAVRVLRAREHRRRHAVLVARAPAPATPATLDATATISASCPCTVSSSACRFVPVPDTSTAIGNFPCTRRTIPAGAPDLDDRGGVTHLTEDPLEAAVQ